MRFVAAARGGKCRKKGSNNEITDYFGVKGKNL